MKYDIDKIKQKLISQNCYFTEKSIHQYHNGEHRPEPTSIEFNFKCENGYCIQYVNVRRFFGLTIGDIVNDDETLVEPLSYFDNEMQELLLNELNEFLEGVE